MRAAGHRRRRILRRLGVDGSAHQLDGRDDRRPDGSDRTIDDIRRSEPLLPLPDARARVAEARAGLDRFGPLAPFLADDRVTEILIDGPGAITVERAGRLERTASHVDRYQLDVLIERMLLPLGLRVDRTSPMVDARLADGSRVNVVVPPLAIDGPLVSIRRFAGPPVPLSAFGPPDVERLLRGLVAARSSVLVTGPTSSGKTTLLGAMGALVDPTERIVSVEDTAELRLGGRHVARMEARPANSEGVGAVPLRRLVLNALRMRPDRLIVGEVRGAEAFDLLLALTSGHRGCLTTCHGLDGPSALRRLETLAALAESGLEPDRLRQLIHDGLDAVVTTARRGRSRQVVAIDRLAGGRLIPCWPDAPGPVTAAPRLVA